MQPISAHLGNRPAPKKDRTHERGELMRYFLERLNPSRIQSGIPRLTMGRMGKLLEQIPTGDLYALKTKCEDAERRGNSFSKRFWFELNPKKYEGRPKPWESAKSVPK